MGLDTLSQGLNAALLIWGGSLILDGRLLVGTLFAFVQLSAGFVGAIFGFVRTYLMLVVLRPQLSRTHAVLAQAPDKRSSRRLSSAARAIPVVMEDVWFRYRPETPWIVKGYTMHVEAGAEARPHRPLRVRKEHHPAVARRPLRAGGGVGQHRRDEPPGGDERHPLPAAVREPLQRVDSPRT